MRRYYLHTRHGIYYAELVTRENLEEVGAVGAEVFGNILQFRKQGA